MLITSKVQIINHINDVIDILADKRAAENLKGWQKHENILQNQPSPLNL